MPNCFEYILPTSILINIYRGGYKFGTGHQSLCNLAGTLLLKLQRF